MPATETSKMELNARTFEDSEAANRWAADFVSLQPGRQLDAQLAKLGQLPVNVPQLQNFILAMNSALTSLPVIQAAHEDVIVEAFRQQLRAVNRLEELRVDRAEGDVGPALDASLWSVTSEFGRREEALHALKIARLVSDDQSSDRKVEWIAGRGL